DDGGVFRSDDGGKTFTRTSDDRNLRQRAWYYTRIYAGPKNVDEVYVVNVSLMRSGDGGKTFSSIRTPHGDHHDLWIDPNDPGRQRRRVRRQLRRLPRPRQPPHRRAAQRHGLAGQPDRSRGRWSEIPVSVELSDLLLAARPERAVLRRQRPLPHHERRPVVAG